jgi:hypothetical protein
MYKLCPVAAIYSEVEFTEDDELESFETSGPSEI